MANPALTPAEQAIVDRFNKATSAVSDRIDKLIAAGVNDSPAFVAELQSIADGLDKLGQPGTPLPV